jgi:diacylglycerol O-acyltransferase
MAPYDYERLSTMDNSFLASETPATPMHVAGLEIFEAGPLRTEHGGIDVGRIRAAYLGVLHRMPRYRQKLMWTPVEDRPVWIDDLHFNLDDHIRHVSLPRPGGEAELKRVASRLIANHLDWRRPLWEAWVIEGLERDRFAILAKTHHCMIDGLAGVEIAQLMLSPSPEEEVAEPEPWRPRPAPTPTELLRDEALRYAGLPLRALRALSSEVEDVGAELRSRYRAMQGFVDASTSASSPTPINGPLGPHRRFDWLTMAMGDVKAIRRKLGCTVNDVFLATATDAFRGVLQDEGLDLGEIVFRASTPVAGPRRD